MDGTIFYWSCDNESSIHPPPYEVLSPRPLWSAPVRMLASALLKHPGLCIFHLAYFSLLLAATLAPSSRSPSLTARRLNTTIPPSASSLLSILPTSTICAYTPSSPLLLSFPLFHSLSRLPITAFRPIHALPIGQGDLRHLSILAHVLIVGCLDSGMDRQLFN
jgi:hypothetical protein